MTDTRSRPANEFEAAADRAAAAGDAASARSLLEQAAAADPGRIELWLKLAALRRATGDPAAAFAAIGEALRLNPLDFLALLSRGRLHESVGNKEEAARDYVHGLAQCPPVDQVPQHLRGLVAHAEANRQAYRRQVGAMWDRAIESDPALDARIRARLARFKTNALHETRVWHSEPTHYHYPGLAEREFHEREDFPWLADLEAETDAIRAEFLALLEERMARAEPYIQYASDAPVRQWTALNHSMDWTAFHLLQNGRTVSANADRCPRTMKVLATIPQPRVAGRSPNAMFSLLKPHTRIPPHTGVANTRLVCHLPLVIPPDCWFRVGAETRTWREGEAFLFDDTIEHEAANDSDEPRCVLIIDAWHPDLNAAERAAITRIMEAEERENGVPL